MGGVSSIGGRHELHLGTWDQQLEAMDFLGNDQKGCSTVAPANLTQISLITSVIQSQPIYGKPVSHGLEALHSQRDNR